MRRRDLLIGLTLSVGGKALAQDVDPADFEARLWRAFPYPRIEVPGAEALAAWERLKAAGGTPIVIGGDEDFLRVAEGVVGYVGDPNVPRTPMEVLAASTLIEHPAALMALRAREDEESRVFVRDMLANPDFIPPASVVNGVRQSDEEARAEYERFAAGEGGGAEIGEWPQEQISGSLGLTVAADVLSGAPFPKVQIVTLPTAHSYEAPAYLNWGGWNECPSPEHQVAAFRGWGERYGAEIIGMSGDVLNVKVTHRPQTREEALALAREQYAFCSDIVEQGVGTLSNLAAGLMADDWWFFWWD